MEAVDTTGATQTKKTIENSVLRRVLRLRCFGFVNSLPRVGSMFPEVFHAFASILSKR